MEAKNLIKIGQDFPDMELMELVDPCTEELLAVEATVVVPLELLSEFLELMSRRNLNEEGEVT